MLSLPLAARAPVSAAIGSYQPGYRVRPRDSRLTAWSAAQRLSSSFSSAGVAVRSGHVSLSMRLTGMGYGTALRGVGAAVPRASDNRVTYFHPGLQEWYANGPLGLEQGFTLARAPAGARRGPLTIALSLAGSAHAKLSSNGTSVDFGSSPSGLRYSGLAAEDASGRPLRSWLSLSSGRLLLHVRTAGARYPVRIDPFVQGAALKSSGGTASDKFGYSVALSADGNTALVGAPYDEDGARSAGEAGAAFVFVHSGSKWEQQGSKLTGTGDEPIFFGSSVALSANGNTALVGAYETAVGGKESEGFDQGAAYVFTRTGSEWKQQEVLVSGESEHYVEFGWSVALSGDGNTALIGGPGFGGHAWFFTRSGVTWSKQGSPLSGGLGNEFGYSVALSGGEGNIALIGSPKGNGGVGVAAVYSRSGVTWQKHATLKGSGEGSEFGYSVALSASGEAVLIGAPEHNSKEGAVYYYTGSGIEWKEEQEIHSPILFFGGHVALSREGTKALIGRTGAGGGVYAYTLSGGKWTLDEELTGGSESLDFGPAVALSETGQTALVGSSFLGGENTVWPFTYEAPGSPPEAVTSAASEVSASRAQLNGKVNPRGKEVSECKLEYGTTASYGSSMACGALPGKGEAPVAVSATVSGLSANTVYHFRVVAKTTAGTSHGEDAILTTLKTSATGETTKEGEPAKAKDEGLSVQGSEGTGKVTIGPYGSNIGGPPLADSEGEYVQVYHSEGASFKKMEYEDCELGGAKTLWWENPASGWEPIQEPVAVYDEASKCIKVTATESTSPSISQLSDPRHVGGPSASEQFGKCEAAKHGHFEDALCGKEKYKEKNGVRSYKGKYEWLPAPVGCFAQKHGKYSEGSCQTEDIKKGQPKGKYEKGANSFKVEGGPLVIAVPSQSSLQCTDIATGPTSSGLMRGPNQSLVTLTLTGCERAGIKCASAGESPGTIISQPLESYSYEENGEYFTALAAQTMMSFSCSTTEFRLSGTIAGQLKAPLNTLITESKAAFSGAVGAQELELEETKSQTHTHYSGATFTTETRTTTEQPVEIKVKP